MTLWKPDPTFYWLPRLAMQAQPEGLAYVAALNPNQDGRPDALTVVDVAPDSPTYGQLVGRVEMPQAGDELHHFGWNACSSALCPYARIRTSSGGIWWSPVSAPRASTSSTSSPIPASPRS